MDYFLPRDLSILDQFDFLFDLFETLIEDRKIASLDELRALAVPTPLENAWYQGASDSPHVECVAEPGESSRFEARLTIRGVPVLASRMLEREPWPEDIAEMDSEQRDMCASHWVISVL